MGTIRLSNDFVSPAISKANPKITLNQKPHQTIVAEIERYWDKETYDSTFTLIPVNLRNKLHLYIHSDTGYAHGQLSWTPNSFLPGGEITSDLTVNVTDATLIPVSIPTGYEDFYLYDSQTNFYEDTNYDNYVTKNNLPAKIVVFDLNNWLLTNSNGLYQMFYNVPHVEYIDVNNLNTTNITSMDSVFYWCNELKYVNASNWNTSNVTSMRAMFDYSKKLEFVDVSNWDTSKVTSMSAMFENCYNLQPINVSNFNTSLVTDTSAMFQSCKLFTSLDLSIWNTGNVTQTYRMFQGCSGLITLDLSNFDTTKVTNMDSMIRDCNNLQYLIIGSNTFKFQLKTSDAVKLPSTCKILVPSALISTYQNATNWTQHSAKFDAIENYNIVRSNGQVTVTPKNA